MTEPLITKYRPQAFEEVVGHDEILGALRRAISSDSRPHSYLFTGPSGIGKTTLARIVASTIEAEVLEVDAASQSSVDATRDLIEMGQYRSLGGSKSKMFIVDECFAPWSCVDTPRGRVRIDAICPGDIVLGARGPARVNRVFQNRVSLTRVLQLTMEAGPPIICSEDHLVLTSEGWCEARNSLGQTIKSAGKKLPEDLLQLWDRIYESRYQQETMRGVRSSYLQDLWKRILGRSDNVFSNMREQAGRLEAAWDSICGANRAYSRGSTTFQQFRSRSGEGPTFIGSYDFTQSDARSKQHCQSSYYESSQWNPDAKEALAGREWSRSFKVSISNLQCFGWLSRICGFNEACRRAKQGFSLLLQGGYCFSRNSICSRGRWRDASQTREQAIGQQERQLFTGTRVVRVESIQSRDLERLRQSGFTHTINNQEFAVFYDLEIEGHPSYNVEGLIVHNCHRLSPQAFDALLKTIEEPPDHLYFALCTTELHRVRETIVTRCYHVPLRPIRDRDVEDLLTVVAELEGWRPDPDVMQMIVTASTGQPRKALSLLQSCHDAPSREEARRIISILDESEPSGDLLRDLVQGRTSWPLIQQRLAQIDDADFESLSQGAARYISSAMVREKSEERARALWTVLDALVFPTSTFDRRAAFIASIGRVIWGG